jgi:GNAT superfamily N-acetyltransferase
MSVEFAGLHDERPGILSALLRASYADLLRTDPGWEPEAENWDQYDREAFAHPTTVGACVFLTVAGGRTAGFASWDPRRGPEYGIVGHNCILPEFRGRGLGKIQLMEILSRFMKLSIRNAKATTLDHPFFVPAQRMYRFCEFRETRRIPWDRDTGFSLIQFESVLHPPTDPSGMKGTVLPPVET